MTRRDRIVVAVIGTAAVLAAYWMLLLGPERHQAARLEGNVAAERQTLRDSLSALSGALAAKRDFAVTYERVARLGQAVPAEDNVPSLSYQLDSAAHAAGVDYRAFKLTGDSSSSTAAPAPAAPAGGPAGSSSSTSGSAPGATAPTATPPAAAPTAAAALPPGALVGPAGFPTMPFSLTFDGSFFRMANFLGRLDRFVRAHGPNVRIGGRLLTLDGIALTASRKGFPRVKATLTATAYLLPANEGASGGATPTAPAGSSTTKASALAPISTP